MHHVRLSRALRATVILLLANTLFAAETPTSAPPLASSNLVGTQQLASPYGPLAIDHSYPTPSTVQHLLDQRIRQRATELYLWSLPLVQFQVMSEQQAHTFNAHGTDFVVMQTFHQKGGVITGNATTPYAIAFVNLAQTGPLVVDLPPGPFTAGALDWWERPILSSAPAWAALVNASGLKLLLVPPGRSLKEFSGKDYVLLSSPTNKVFIGARGLTSSAQVMTDLQQGLQVYPYETPPTTAKFITHVDQPWSAKPPVGLDYFKALHRAIQGEPVQPQDAPYISFLKTLGIEDGKPFEPEPHLAHLIAEGAALGELTARALTLERPHTKPFWPGTHWFRLVDFPLPQFDRQRLYVDERATWFYEAITTTPQMMTNTPGLGQVLLDTKRDQHGQPLHGGETYRLRLPAHPPATQFWAVTLYAADTRQFVRTPQQNANLDQHSPNLHHNPDGSLDLYFGPNTNKIPTQFHANWLQTNPGEGWFAYLRLAAPTANFFDQSWAPHDLERLP